MRVDEVPQDGDGDDGEDLWDEGFWGWGDVAEVRAGGGVHGEVCTGKALVRNGRDSWGMCV